MKSLPTVEHPLNVNKSKANRFLGPDEAAEILVFYVHSVRHLGFRIQLCTVWGWLMAFQNY